MRYSLAALALAALASANPVPQAPATAASSDCQASYDGTFEIQVVNKTMSKRSLDKVSVLTSRDLRPFLLTTETETIHRPDAHPPGR